MEQEPGTINTHVPDVVMQEGHRGGASSSTSRVAKALPDARHGAASMLVGKVVDLMSMHFDAGTFVNNHPLFADLCLSLTKGIDHAVANNEVPRRYRDLPPLLKQVYGSPNGFSVQVGSMILTLSIQCTCKLQWFSDQDTNDLLKLAKEAMKTFSDPDCILNEPTHAPRVSEVMSRFYPNMKVERLLFSLEMKPGYRICVAEFPIIRGTISPKKEKVYLLVAQVDNLKTSASIITPAAMNFLLNGQAVEGRTHGSLDKGPQLPTNVTRKLKFGVNCLQAIGPCEGNYLLVIAVMTTTQSSNLVELQDFGQPIALTNSETQTMQMSSRISLNCPISKSRIKTPVKGKLCKHFQCFDYDNFLEINSKRPSWECPHCKQPVSYVDICVDQNFVKVLSEAEEKVVNVIMLANGSWREDKGHPAQMSGDSQVGHQNDESRSTTDRSTSLQNYNETVSGAGTSVPTQKLPSNVLCSAISSQAPVNIDSHDNSVQPLQKDGSLHAQSSGADTSSTAPFKHQIRQHSSFPVSNSSEALSNTENVVCSSVPARMEPVERIVTVQASSAFQQAAHLPKDAPFPFTTPRTSSRMNSTVVIREERRIRNDELKSSGAAAGESADWRPRNRMRGSLTGEAYSAALQQFGIQPTLQAQASRPPSSAVSIRGPLTHAVADRSASQTEKSSKPG